MPVEVVAVLLIFGLPVVAVLTSHHRKVLELKLRLRNQADTDVLTQIAEVKRQVMELRDTTTRYDLGFDAALQRLEGRMGAMEQRVGRLEANDQTVMGRQ